MVEVSSRANDRYFAEMMRRRKRQIFWQESCGLANSYYFDDHGDVPLRPVPTIETMWRARRYPLSDYRYERLAPEGHPEDVPVEPRAAGATALPPTTPCGSP